MLARRLFELYIYMTIDIGLVHADPHAGNIGIKKDGTFVLYDFGAIIDVRDAKQYIAKCLKSVVLEDTDGVVRSLEDMGVIKSGGSVARLKKAIPKIKKIMESEDFNVELSKLPEFTSNENRIFELTTRYIYLIRSLTIVEGIISYHDRDFSLTKYIKKYDDVIDDIVDVPAMDIVREIAGDFLTTPASLKNMNDLVFSIKEELSEEISGGKRMMKYVFGVLVFIEIVKML
jgi:predicted unusual protein kinase regulating ubiquinone biosynthesis (AarF/ABC1/UbiB family)